jgi:hypothetical protein
VLAEVSTGDGLTRQEAQLLAIHHGSSGLALDRAIDLILTLALPASEDS